MADIKSPEERSRNMAAIKGKDTEPEIFLRKGLFARGYRYRVVPSYIEGHPDMYFPRYHTAVFIHGCFWHRHTDCKYSYMPKSRIDFWVKKFTANIRRDAIVKEKLREKKIRTLIIWECAIKKAKKKTWSDESLFRAVEEFLNSEIDYKELSEEDIMPLSEEETT